MSWCLRVLSTNTGWWSGLILFWLLLAEGGEILFLGRPLSSCLVGPLWAEEGRRRDRMEVEFEHAPGASGWDSCRIPYLWHLSFQKEINEREVGCRGEGRGKRGRVRGRGGRGVETLNYIFSFDYKITFQRWTALTLLFTTDTLSFSWRHECFIKCLMEIV